MISQDITFDESCPYYPHSSSGSPSPDVEYVSFLTLSDVHLPLSRSLSSSPTSTSRSSSPPHTSTPPSTPPTSTPLSAPPVVPPSTLEEPSHELPSRDFTHVYRHRPRPPPTSPPHELHELPSHEITHVYSRCPWPPPPSPQLPLPLLLDLSTRPLSMLFVTVVLSILRIAMASLLLRLLSQPCTRGCCPPRLAACHV